MATWYLVVLAVNSIPVTIHLKKHFKYLACFLTDKSYWLCHIEDKVGIRDEEIQRLIHYGKGMGVKVIIYSESSPGADAEWTLDGSMIQIYGVKNKSKTDVILDLIHELGHHVWFVHEKDRQPDMKFDEAITRENLSQEETGVPTPKHLRKKIWDVEVAGTKWWETIYKDTNVKIPMWKLEAAKEFDMWMYEMYYETGHFPKGKGKREYYLKVQQKYRPS